MQDVQSDLEILHAGISQDQNAINKWFNESTTEQKQLSLRQSQHAGNPFLNKNGGAGEELGPNSLIKIKKSELDQLLNSLHTQSKDLESLKQKVEQQKNDAKNEFTKLNGSIIYKHGFHAPKPFEITLNQIKQLAQTPVGYSLHMLDTFDLTEAQYEQ